jgi:hypothetical protein
MRHPNPAVLRRLLDEPAAVADTDRAHVAGCTDCLDHLAAARADALGADVTHPPLARTVSAQNANAHTVGTDAVPTRAVRAASLPSAATSTPAPGRLRRALRRPAVAALGAAVVLTGAGAAAAGDWLPIFRTEQIAPVGVSADDLVALPDLSSLGEVEVTGDPDVHAVADAAAAAEETGLDVPVVSTMPRGVDGEAVHQVGGEVSAVLTFSPERAARAAADAGTTLPTPPPGLDGAQIRLVAGPGVAQVWQQETGVPSLVVARAVAPTASSTGIPFTSARDYLLSLPGLPDEVVAQLRTFTGDGSTLPLPVPADQVTTTQTEVNGAPATVLQSRDRTMAAVVWVEDGVVTAVAGSLDPDEVLTVARTLR